MAKQKQKNLTKKEILGEFERMGNGISLAFQEIRTIKQHLIGLENLTMLLAKFLKKEKEFEQFITDFYEKEKAKINKIEKEKEEAK